MALTSLYGNVAWVWQMNHGRVTVDASGRVVVPKDVRLALGIEKGGELFLSVEDGALVAITQAEALRRLQAVVRAALPPDVSLVEELIADRRAEAARFAARFLDRD